MKIPAAEKALEILRTAALGYPEAYEDHPWGDTVYKVKGKIFTFLGATAEGFGISVKLPLSNSVALMLPFVEPTGYGLGKSGWVSARFGPKAHIPLDMLAAWIDESYRAVAPKKLAATLPPASKSDPSPAKPAAKPAPAKPAAKKPAPAKPAAKKPAPAKRAPAKPAAKPAAAKKPAPKPAAKKPAPKPAAKKPAPRPAAKKAAAKKPPR